MINCALYEDSRNSDQSNLASTNIESEVEDHVSYGLLIFIAQTGLWSHSTLIPLGLALTTVDPDKMMNGLAQLTVEVFLVICRQVKDYHDAGRDGAFHLKDQHLELRPRLIT